MEGSARPRTALNECVRVVVRCRPLSQRERALGHDEISKKPDKKWYERLSSRSDRKDLVLPIQVVRVFPERGAVQVSNPRGHDKLFTYDAVYDNQADTQTIYDEMVRPLVSSVLDGFNGCVFAYGQTGAGKTHTMEGGAAGADEGIVPRAFRHIWEHIAASPPALTHLVSCSYVELYLEDVRDLLHPEARKLTIRGQELNGFYIPEMTSVVCKSAADMMRVLRTGNKQRATGRTDMNEHSSRSHAVLLVTVETAHAGSQRIRVGKLNLVDLAGSERQRKTGAGGERLREAARINQALSSLGNVISALAENSPHVPYRDSKLTRILQDSLGGNSKTIMIANVGPAAYNYDETVTTLRYAHRAKAIKNKPVRNEDPKDAKLKEYQEEIERLRTLLEQRRTHERKPRKHNKKLAPDIHQQAEPPEDPSVLESEHQVADTFIEQERTRSDQLEARIRALEDRLVQGGGGGGGKELLNSLNRSKLELERRTQEIAERRRREVEMRQRLELEEETTAGVTSTYAGLQCELEQRAARLQRVLARYGALREEAHDTREAHDAERREREALQAALVAALRRRLLLADSFVPSAGRALVLALRYDEDNDCWERPARAPAPAPARPLSAPTRRPLSEAARAPRAPPRLRCEDLLDLQPLPLPGTTRRYEPAPSPTPAPAPGTRAPASTARTPAPGRGPSRPATAHHRLGAAAPGVR